VKLDFWKAPFLWRCFSVFLPHHSTLHCFAYRGSLVCGGYRNRPATKSATLAFKGAEEQIICIDFAALLLEVGRI
jgi:hypothetical protein